MSNTVNGAGTGIINPTEFKQALELIDESGNLLVGGVVIREITTAQAVTDVPADGEIVSIEGQTVVGDGVTVARNFLPYTEILWHPEITLTPDGSNNITIGWEHLGRVVAIDATSDPTVVITPGTGKNLASFIIHITETNGGVNGIGFNPVVDYSSDPNYSGGITSEGYHKLSRVGSGNNDWHVRIGIT